MMHTCRYHLHNLFYEKDPTDYLLTHKEEIKLSLDNSVESRWRKLKRFVEAYKMLTLTMDKNPAHDTCIYFLLEMERLEKAYSDKGEK